MKNKLIITFISMFLGLILLNTAIAYSAYINIYIVDLDTNTDAEEDTIYLVDNAASPIQWAVNGTGCGPVYHTDDIATGEYSDNSTISTGSAVTLTEGSVCTLYLQVDEVKVGTNYFGSCVTNDEQAGCTDCSNVAANCRNDATSYATPTNGYVTLEASASPGDTGACTVDVNFGRCSEEVQDQLDAAGTSEFTFTFTA